MTYMGGVATVGGLFQFDPQTNDYQKQFDFHTSEIGNMSIASMIYANDKMLYGITETGGIKNKGTIFQYDPTLDVYTKKFDFLGVSTGEIPIGGIVQASNGKIYGTTSLGGAHNKGVLFEFDPITNVYKPEFEFDSVNGSTPLGELMQASDGKIYGMTREGGVSESGVLFQYDPATAKLVKKYDFKDDGKGKNPEGGLVEDNGKLLGVTTSGGANINGNFPDGLGAIFKYDLATGNYSKEVDADSINGTFPNGTLVKTADGKYYGMATRGGALRDKSMPDGYGTIYQYDPATSTISAKFNFNGLENGKLPNGSLLLAADGNFYGVTNSGGVANYGVLFQFNPKTGVYTKKIDFTKSIGMLAERCKLIEISSANSIAENEQSQLHIYPNPGKDQVTVLLNKTVENATLNVYTLTGQLVLQKEKLFGDKFQLQIENLASGTYFMELIENGVSSRNKLIKN